MTFRGFRRTFAALLLSFTAACASSSTPADATSLSGDEETTFGTSGGTLSSNQETVSLADSLFDFDPTIDPAATPDANAAAVGANTKTNLGTCGSVTVAGATVAVDFGAPPGCTLANGAVVSGKVSVAVSKSGTTTSLALTLTDVVVNGTTVAGQATFATSNGSTFTVTSSLAGATKSETSNLTVVGAASSFTISGTAQVTDSGTTSSVVFKDVVHAKGECYAHSGSMTVTKGLLTETVTFTSNTPQTGQVTVQIGKKTSISTLPAYGSCPSGGSSTSDSGTGGRDGGLSR